MSYKIFRISSANRKYREISLETRIISFDSKWAIMFPDPKKIQSELACRNQLRVEENDSFYFAFLNPVCSSLKASKITPLLADVFPISNPALPFLQHCLAVGAPCLETNY